MPATADNPALRFCLAAAGLLGAIAVALGAFHAHGLQGYLENSGLSPDLVVRRMDNCATGVRYQMFSALALLALAALSGARATKWPIFISLGFVVGTLLFSGSLYGIVFWEKPWLGAITPLGGGTLIVTWLALTASAIRGRHPHDA